MTKKLNYCIKYYLVTVLCFIPSLIISQEKYPVKDVIKSMIAIMAYSEEERMNEMVDYAKTIGLKPSLNDNYLFDSFPNYEYPFIFKLNPTENGVVINLIFADFNKEDYLSGDVGFKSIDDAIYYLQEIMFELSPGMLWNIWDQFYEASEKGEMSLEKISNRKLRDPSTNSTFTGSNFWAVSNLEYTYDDSGNIIGMGNGAGAFLAPENLMIDVNYRIQKLNDKYAIFFNRTISNTENKVQRFNLEKLLSLKNLYDRE